MAIFQTATANNTPYTLSGLPDGPDGVDLTLRAMRKFVKEAKVDPDFIAFAKQVIRGIPGKDFVAEAAKIHQWVQNNIRYVADPVDVEFVQSPEALLISRQGDCDDMATITAAMLESTGHPARLVAVGFDTGGFEHVYIETKIGTRWIASDASESEPFGWAPDGVVLRMVRHI